MTMSENVVSRSSASASNGGCRLADNQDDQPQDLNELIQLAEKFIEEIIEKATQDVLTNKKHRLALIERQQTLHNPPEILLDLVGPRSPTPEEETFPWVSQATNNAQPDEIENDDVEATRTQEEAEPAETVTPETSSYVRGIIEKATEIAAEKIKTGTRLKGGPDNAARTETMVLSGQPQTTSVKTLPSETNYQTTEEERLGTEPNWFDRVRIIVTNIIRSNCFSGFCNRDRDPDETFL